MIPMQLRRCARAPRAPIAALRETAPDDPCGSVQTLVFGKFRLDLVREQLIGPAGRQVLRRQVFATLRLMLEAAPALVTLDELLDQVWGRHAISPSAVPHVIVELRRALGDPAQAPQYIETRHRRGYRIIPTVIRDLAPKQNEGHALAPRAQARQPDSELLRVIDELRAMSKHASPQHRLEFLQRAAGERGLTFLALQAQLALQTCADEASLSANSLEPDADRPRMGTRRS